MIPKATLHAYAHLVSLGHIGITVHGQELLQQLGQGLYQLCCTGNAT